MKTIHSIAIAASLAALVASAPALAQHRGHFGGGPRISIGLGFGAPFYPYRPYPYYYAPYYSPYYYPPVAVVPAAPPVYIERPDQDPAQPLYQPQYQPQYQSQPQYQPQPQSQYQPPAPPQPQAQAQAQTGQNDWFYCPDSKTYYPYVQQCAGEWQRVTPQPPAR